MNLRLMILAEKQFFEFGNNSLDLQINEKEC